MKGVYILLILWLGPLAEEASAAGDKSDYGHIGLSGAVLVTLGNHYGHYDLIHSRRIHGHRGLSFEIILQHRDAFVNVSVGSGGRFYRETYYDHYPLADHYCDEYCNFHYQHYEPGHHASYDPYYGCSYHVGLLINRYPRYVYRPYFGYANVYYHSKYGHYKRFRHHYPYQRYGYNQHYGHRKYHGNNQHGHHRNYQHGESYGKHKGSHHKGQKDHHYDSRDYQHKYQRDRHRIGSSHGGDKKYRQDKSHRGYRESDGRIRRENERSHRDRHEIDRNRKRDGHHGNIQYRERRSS